jgi:ribosomal protein L12E/L44/L45/RPP1/RPP2
VVRRGRIHQTTKENDMRKLAFLVLGVSLVSFSGCAEQAGKKDDKKAEKKDDDKKEEKKEEKKE